MTFASIEFVVFFVAVLLLYYRMGLRAQNVMLLAASYVFYGWWDWRFLGLLLLSTVIDYLGGIMIHRTEVPRTRKTWLIVSMVSNLGILFLFKYFNFFTDSLLVLLSNLGLQVDPRGTLPRIILPVGISFYTFQTMSYTIDIYRRQLAPTRDFLNFALFVTFFPQLVAGPIERASNLLPQVERERHVRPSDITSGTWLILLGFFKKVVVADNLGRIVATVFDYPGMVRGWDVAIGGWAFAFQVYGDFGGYSDIARGTSRLLGFELMRNFRMPYFSTNPPEYWGRWHISLSTWLRDYLYLPLGGNRNGTGQTYRNLILTMLLGGIWHGAAWHYVAWGAYSGLLLVVHRALLGRVPQEQIQGKSPWTPWRCLKAVVFFNVICIGLVVFRANDLPELSILWGRMALGGSEILGPACAAFLLLLPLLAIDLAQEYSGDEIVVHRWPFALRVATYAVLGAAIITFGVRDGSDFIYFQF